jgi:hypothetical protein
MRSSKWKWMVVEEIVSKLDLSLEGRQKLVSYNHRLTGLKSHCSSLRLVESDSLSCCALPIYSLPGERHTYGSRAFIINTKN